MDEENTINHIKPLKNVRKQEYYMNKAKVFPFNTTEHSMNTTKWSVLLILSGQVTITN